jgi:hypothetical protein
VCAALWKQGTEIKDCSLNSGLLCTRTSKQRSKTHIHMLMIRSFNNQGKIIIFFNIRNIIVVTIFNKHVS